MDNFTSEFREWMDLRELAASEVAKSMGIGEQTLRNWRSAGVPARRHDFVRMKMEAYDAKQVEALRELDVITLEVEREQFDNWNRAALAEGLIIREWASKGLDRLAREEFNRPLKVVPDSEETTIQLGYRFAGSMAAGQPVESQLQNETLPANCQLDPDTHVIYEVNGQSAEPDFMDGERWLVEITKKGMTAKKGKPAVFRDAQGCYLKIYEGGKVPFRSVNPDFPDVHASDGLELVGYPVERINS